MSTHFDISQLSGILTS